MSINKKGYARLVIFGVPVALILGLFSIGAETWITGQAISAIEPSLANLLQQLDDKMICPPELSNADYHVCFGKSGEVIINGNVNHELTIKIDETTNICSVKIGQYTDSQVCTLNNLWQAEKLYVAGMGFFNSKTIQISKLASYTKSGKYLRALRIIKYLPK